MSERADFTAMLAQSGLAHADAVAGLQASDRNQALRALALALPDDMPSIAVIDEVPWLVEQDRLPAAGTRQSASALLVAGELSMLGEFR
jgi:uncharacterized protein